MLGVNEILGEGSDDEEGGPAGSDGDEPAGSDALVDVQDFWTQERRTRYPTFAAALQHVLALPAGNIAAESLFSHCDLVNTKRRSRQDDSLLSTFATLHYEDYSMVKELVESSVVATHANTGGSA